MAGLEWCFADTLIGVSLRVLAPWTELVEDAAQFAKSSSSAISVRVSAPWIELVEDAAQLAMHVSENSKDFAKYWMGNKAGRIDADKNAFKNERDSSMHIPITSVSARNAAPQSLCSCRPKYQQFQLQHPLHRHESQQDVRRGESHPLVALHEASVQTLNVCLLGMVSSCMPVVHPLGNLLLALSVPTVPISGWSVFCAACMLGLAIQFRNRRPDSESQYIQRCSCFSFTFNSLWYLTVGLNPYFPADVLNGLSVMPFPITAMLLAKQVVTYPLEVWCFGKLARMNLWDRLCMMGTSVGVSLICALASALPVHPLLQVIMMLWVLKSAQELRGTMVQHGQLAPVANQGVCHRATDRIISVTRVHVCLQVTGSIFLWDPIIVFGFCDAIAEAAVFYSMIESRVSLDVEFLETDIALRLSSRSCREPVPCQIIAQEGVFTIRDRVFNFVDYQNNQCMICMDGHDAWDLWIGCRHIMCQTCSTEVVTNQRPCPFCRIYSYNIWRRKALDDQPRVAKSSSFLSTTS